MKWRKAVKTRAREGDEGEQAPVYSMRRAEKNTWGLYMATFPHCRQPEIRHPHTRSDAPEVIKVAQRERRFAKDPELARPGAKWAQ